MRKQADQLLLQGSKKTIIYRQKLDQKSIALAHTRASYEIRFAIAVVVVDVWGPFVFDSAYEVIRYRYDREFGVNKLCH